MNTNIRKGERIMNEHEYTKGERITNENEYTKVKKHIIRKIVEVSKPPFVYSYDS